MSTTAAHRRYLATVALFEGATTFGEAVAAAEAILRMESKHGFTTDDAPYFRCAYPCDYVFSADDILSIAVCVTMDVDGVKGLSNCAQQAFLAYLAAPKLIGAAQALYCDRDIQNERAWNVLEAARTFRADFEAARMAA